MVELTRREFSLGAVSVVVSDSVLCNSTIISDTTIRNWERLGLSHSNRLTSRANKRMSKKRIIPAEYFSKPNNVAFAQKIIDFVDANDIEIKSVIRSLAILVIESEGLSSKDNVKRILEEVKDWGSVDLSLCGTFEDGEQDLLGGVYQSLLFEGERNEGGVYYTCNEVAKALISACKKMQDKTFLDPCCGSGSILCSIEGIEPEDIYGIDRDPIAVFLTKINLVRKFPNKDFFPKIVCADYLGLCDNSLAELLGCSQFDNICTNPPWGAVSSRADYEMGCSNIKEVFALFYIKSFGHLSKNGIISFLLPQAILNVATHRDIRHFMLSHGSLKSIMQFDKLFSGVTTKYVRIVAVNEDSQPSDCVSYEDFDKGKIGETPIAEIHKRADLSFLFIGGAEIEIVDKMLSASKYSLSNSLWALGIVTGDNKGKLKDKLLPGTEPIYTGKEIKRYRLLPPKKFIHFKRESMQQAAKDEFYRANEKLVYRFISNRPIFAYDKTKSLTLNSANVLIPQVPGWSAKAMVGLLNSDAVAFFYIRTCGGTKVLKSHLCSIPIPEISQNQDRMISTLVDEAIYGNEEAHERLQNLIYSLYSLSEIESKQIKESLNGKATSDSQCQD